MKASFANTWRILRPRERGKFLRLIMLEIFMNLLDIISLVALLWIIKLYVTQGSKEVYFLPHQLQDRNSLLPIGIFLFLFALKNMAAYSITRSINRFIGDVAVRISRIHLQTFQQAPYAEFINVDSSVQIRKIAFQPYEFCQYILAGIQQIITQSSLIVLAIIAILLFDARLFFLLLLILLPPALLVFYLIKKSSEKNRKGIQIANEISFRYLMDALKGFVEGNIYGKNHFFMNRFIGERKSFSRYLFRSASLQSLPSRFIEVFAVLGLFLLVLISKISNNNSATLILVGAFMAAAYKIIPGIVKIINAAGQVKAYEFALNELVKEAAAATTLPGNIKRVRIDSIQMKSVQFRFGQNQVLNDFNLSLRPGDFIGITGKSGIGKTTLLNMLTGLLVPDAGELFVNCEKKEWGDLKTHWPQVSYVRQQAFLFNDSVLRNIVMDAGEIDEERLSDVIRITGLNTLLSGYPEGTGMQITENGKNISGGQQQRISIARALYHDASIFLLDEPFNELDEMSETALLVNFKEMARDGKMVIMVTHNKRALSYCNKIVSLDD